MTNEEILVEYKNELKRTGKSQNTVTGYLNNISQFLSWIDQSNGEVNLERDGITATDVRLYRSYLDTSKKYKLSAINTKLAAIQNFCNFLSTTYNKEAIKVEKKKGHINPKVEVLSKQELYQFLKYVDINANLLHKTIVYTILNTGMRESEVADLELNDIANLDSTKCSRIIIRNGKGDKYREVNISGEYKSLLREYLSYRPTSSSDKVFIGTRGAISANGIYKIISRLGQQKGLHVYPHMLRHQYLTTLAKNCTTLEDMKALQEIAGHSSIETTMKFYVHSSEEAKEKITQNISYF